MNVTLNMMNKNHIEDVLEVSSLSLKETWSKDSYNKESMQRAIMVCTLAYSVTQERTAKDSDLFARTLLEKEISSGYKLSGLVKE